MSRTRDTAGKGIKLHPVSGEAWEDYRTGDSRWIVGVKRRIHSVRDVLALVVEMARRIASAPRSQRGCLVLADPRMSRERLTEEWRTLQGLLHPGVVKRIALMVLEREGNWWLPEEGPIAAIGAAIRLKVPPDTTRERPRHPAASPKSFEILKVLTHHWLLRRGPTAISELMRISGCSYPTVANALREWQRSEDVVRHSNRRVSLRGLPNHAWDQALALLQALRRPVAFGARSERPIDLQDLLRRLERTGLPGLALGGVVAARHWDPVFDLHGLPRLDLCLHIPSGEVPADLLAPLDPSLRRVDGPGGGGRILVHPVQRPESLFVTPKGSVMPIADPVETLLDLQELHLTAQADALVLRLTGEEKR